MANSKFIDTLLQNINGSSYYAVRRSFGQTVDSCNIDSLLAFMRLIPDAKVPKSYLNIEFLVAGLCYNSLRPGMTYLGKNKISFETLLRRLYNTASDSGKRSIENFMKLRIDDRGYFHKRFMSITRKALPMLRPNEVINYDELISDLVDWDKNNTVKIKWSKILVDFN